MSATIVRIEGLADSWSGTVEVAGRSQPVSSESLDGAMEAAFAAYREMTAPPPEPVVEPEPPAGDPAPEEPTDPAPQAPAPEAPPAAAPDEPAAGPATVPDPAPPPTEPAIPVTVTPAPDGGGTVTSAPISEEPAPPAPPPPAPGPTLEQRAQARSGLSDEAWAGLPQDDRDVLITEQAAFEGHA